MNNPAGKIAWLVDDNKSVRSSMGAVLHAFGIDVQLCASAAEFLESFDPGTTGCLVADYDMPGMTGLELLETLRARGCTLPVVIITGRGDAALEQRILAAGGLRMLHKPVDSDELFVLIEKAMLNNG
ncbi:MAG: response regulator [Rhizomicrobium sp.]